MKTGTFGEHLWFGKKDFSLYLYNSITEYGARDRLSVTISIRLLRLCQIY